MSLSFIQLSSTMSVCIPLYIILILLVSSIVLVIHRGLKERMNTAQKANTKDVEESLTLYTMVSRVMFTLSIFLFWLPLLLVMYFLLCYLFRGGTATSTYISAWCVLLYSLLLMPLFLFILIAMMIGINVSTVPRLSHIYIPCLFVWSTLFLTYLLPFVMSVHVVTTSTITATS